MFKLKFFEPYAEDEEVAKILEVSKSEFCLYQNCDPNIKKLVTK